MSTLLEDLDFYDATVKEHDVEPLAGADGTTRKSVNLPCQPDDNENDDDDDSGEDDEEENDEEDEGDEGVDGGDNQDEPDENDQKLQEALRHRTCGRDLDAEKPEDDDDRGSGKFSTGLWSEQESMDPSTVDCWDIPPGAVPWDDSLKPMEQLLSYADLTLTPEEENGLLTDRIVAACSSYLTESPGNKCRVVGKVTLNNKNLNDIRILGYHRFLQYVNLSWNNLTDLTPLGCIPYLMYLDVSHNLLTEVLRFRPPLNLTYVNYSYNEVWQIDDLTEFWTISYLDLSHNNISKIQGLENLKYLRYLDLSHNQIERFENLNNLRVTDLNLEYNLISRFETELGLGMCTMPCLSNMYLNNNLIKDLDFLQNVYHLKKLELQGNQIADMAQLTKMKHMKNLRQLDMTGNPVSETKPYRSLLLSFFQDLTFLDQAEVTVGERIAACKSNRFDLQLEAARNNARMILLEQLNDTTLGMDVLPVDQSSYPFVILVGPSASSKKYLISCLAEKYPDKVYVGKLHTTRKVLDTENTLLIETNREDFNDMVKSGKFFVVYENLGQFYGFSRDELGNAVNEHKLCLTSMDVVSALTIHSYGLRPFLVLTILRSREEHVRRLRISYGPVYSVLGAAYISRRQLVDNHESNIRRVESLLAELLDQVVKMCPESCMSGEDDNSADDQSSSPSKSEEVVLNPENATPRVCYNYGKTCYACSPRKCGYQTYKTQASECNSGVTEEFQSLYSIEEETTRDTSDTSYSAMKSTPIRIHFTSSDLSTYGEGEQDPFADISMPFIDWSEVNLSGLQLEEAAELLCQKCIDEVLVTRDTYENLHLDNPGLFSLSVFTDDATEAMKTIADFLKEVWRTTPSRQPSYDVKSDLVYQTMVPQKLNQLKEILQNDFLSSGDSTTAGNADIPPIDSPVTMCREMRLKGYGDSLDDM